MIPKTGAEWGWFFLTAFVLAIAINLMSSYLKPVTDRWLGRFSDYRRISSEKERKRVDEMVQWMLDNPAAVAIVSGGITRRMLLFLFAVLVAFVGINSAPSPASTIQVLALWVVVAVVVALNVAGEVAAMAFLTRCINRYTILDRERRKSPVEASTESE